MGSESGVVSLLDVFFGSEKSSSLRIRDGCIAVGPALVGHSRPTAAGQPGASGGHGIAPSSDLLPAFLLHLSDSDAAAPGVSVAGTGEGTRPVASPDSTAGWFGVSCMFDSDVDRPLAPGADPRTA